MMGWVVKLTKHYGQYRITLPRELLEEAGLEGAEFVRLVSGITGQIIIEEYYGKGKEKGNIPEDQA